MNAWLLVPVKGLAAGKSRLRGWLDDAARVALNEFFLRCTLANACAFPGAAQTLVISDCASALRIAAGLGARAMAQRSGPGLNRAAREGVDALQRLGAERVIVLMADLPAVRSRDVQALAGRFADNVSVTICPDKNGTGTNALMIPAGTAMNTCFGEASLVRHCREAIRAGLVPRLHHDPRIALDIDTPSDLLEWLRARHDGANGIIAGAQLRALMRDVQGIAAQASLREPGSLAALDAQDDQNTDLGGMPRAAVDLDAVDDDYVREGQALSLPALGSVW